MEPFNSKSALPPKCPTISFCIAVKVPFNPYTEVNDAIATIMPRTVSITRIFLCLKYASANLIVNIC